MLENNVTEQYDEGSLHHTVPEQGSSKMLPTTAYDIKDAGTTEEKEGQEEEIIYDSKFVDALIAENENLKAENFKLKKDYQELETKYNEVIEPYQVKESVIVNNDQEIPLIIKLDPYRRTITVELDKEKSKN
jgi:hypothetical protein